MGGESTGALCSERALRLGVTDGYPARGAPHPPRPRSGFMSWCDSTRRAPRCPQSRGDKRRCRPSLFVSPGIPAPWGAPSLLPPTFPGLPYHPEPPPAPSPPSSPMLPSMEIFLRRFWKLDSREPAGLWQCRLAGVDMAVPSGNSRGSRLLPRT